MGIKLMPIIKIVDATTGEEIEREMNAEELAQWETNKANAETQKAVQAQKAAEKAALLTKLGITADEAVLLLS
jgi:hypothetical protein